MKDFVSLTIPARAEYASVLRLTVAAVVSKADACIDDIEDLRVAVSEAFTKMLPAEEVKVEILCTKEDVKITLLSSVDVNMEEGDMGALILASLMDKVTVKEKAVQMQKVFKVC